MLLNIMHHLKLLESKTINGELVCYYGENKIKSKSDGKTVKHCKAYKKFPITKN